jgi:hypothetical protein
MPNKRPLPVLRVHHISLWFYEELLNRIETRRCYSLLFIQAVIFAAAHRRDVTAAHRT